MRTISVLAIALVLGVGCEPTKKSAFEEKRASARSSVTYERRVGAGRLVANCCYPDSIDPSGRQGLRATQAAACGEVGRLLVAEVENDVLERLIAFTEARCYRQFPVSTLARLCTRSQCSLPIRRELVRMLAAMDPDSELTAALLAQIVDGDDALRSDVAFGLGTMGEADLWPAIEALSSPHPVVRMTAAEGFAYAVHPTVGGPLDLPSVVPALLRATHDMEPKVAASARIALNGYRAWLPLSPEQLVDHVERAAPASIAIRILGVRRFSCQTDAAAKALARRAKEPGLDGLEAKDALALRKQRCPRLAE